MKLISTLPSRNHGPREPGTVVDMLVLHYTGMPTARAALTRLCDPATEVSAHYLVNEDGGIMRLVAEDRRAWHAGISWWRGQSDINNRSIGIEIVNPGHEFGYRPFPEAQMAAVEALCRDILGRHHAIPARNVVGHSDVAPWRKEDPGELFDWARLARAGIGLWPDEAAVAAAPASGDPRALLEGIGYRVDGDSSVERALIAFQRHFRPADIGGWADTDTLRRLNAVLALAAPKA
ncbi:N-acetylmuramoyl-L-alanine amidase [Novispirillum sp. DQ9]|uniref:N-acetylmuramoyl-L-alanine amidase n=1 Tax=Novispirillum sp. DQ9 TaxID=3398612 RepID=UPI003C7E39FA